MTDQANLNRTLIAATQLDTNMTAQAITLTREEAVLAQGLLEGAAVALEMDAPKP